MADVALWLVDVGLKSFALLGVVTLVVAGMRWSSAARRHLVWCVGMVGLIVLPLASGLLPRWAMLPAAMDPAPMIRPERRFPTGSTQGTRPGSIDVLGASRAGISPRAMVGEGGEAVTPVAENHPPSARLRAFGEAEPLDQSASSRGFSQAEGLLLAWTIGALVCLLPIPIGPISLRRLERHAEPVADESWCSLLREVSDRVGVKRPFALLVSTRRTMPMTWGVWPGGPVRVLFPQGAFAWSAERRRITLLHEMAHVSRHDCLTHLFAQVVRALYWFNPLAWLAVRRMVFERERACDDFVAAAGSKPSDYAEQLLEIIRSFQPSRCGVLCGVAMASRSQIEGRMQAILDATRNRRRVTSRAFVTGLFVVGCVAAPLGSMRPATAENTLPDDLGTSLIEAFRTNRDKLKCGVLSWTRTTVEDGFVPGSTGRLETAGAFKMWWEEDRFATAYLQDQKNAARGRSTWTTVESGGSSYDGGLLSRKPKLRLYENWLTQIARWTGSNSLDEQLLQLQKLPDITTTWSVIHVDGNKMIRLLGKNEEDGTRIIEHYDPSRGHNLLRREWYDGTGHLYMEHTHKIAKVADSVWFPIQVDMKSMDQDGKVVLHLHCALDMNRCSFNDRDALPRGVFQASKGVLEHKCNDELTKAYAEAKKRQAGAALIADTVAKKDEVAIRQIISKFAKAAEQGGEQTVSRLLDKRTYQNRAASVIKDMRESIALGAMPAIITSVSIRGDRALVVTDFFDFSDPRVKGKQCLVYRVARNGTDWVIRDIDMENTNGLIREIRRFDARASSATSQPTTQPRTAPPSTR